MLLLQPTKNKQPCVHYVEFLSKKTIKKVVFSSQLRAKMGEAALKFLDFNCSLKAHFAKIYDTAVFSCEILGYYKNPL